MNAALFAYSRRGCATARRVMAALADWDIQPYTMERFAEEGFAPLGRPAREFYGPIFGSVQAMIFVSSVGLAVREVAPHLKSKATDPAVLVLDELGQYVIPVLSGHIGGANELAKALAASLGAQGPQVLIIHTHGSESYTMPPGQEYDVSDTFRTLDTNCNMIRVGDEMARTLTECGISVVHDRSLYDYPSYSGAYNRSLASIERYLEKYPSISFVLDVHRDAVQDANGNQFKLLCGEDAGAAQLEFVIGSNGGGLSHDLWRENLKLACAVQETLYKDYPTLMRPVTVRNSRYNQHMTTGSLLVEVGTAGNSLEEAVNGARLFAAGFAQTVKNGG